MSAMSLVSRGLGVITALALVIGMAVMPGSDAVAAPAEVEAPQFDPNVSLPAVESTPVEAVAPTVPEGDFGLDRLPALIDLPARSFTRPM